MRIAKCESCQWAGLETDLMARPPYDMVQLVCPNCGSREMILGPLIISRDEDTEKIWDSKEHKACQNVLKSTKIAEDQEAASRAHLDVTPCNDPLCDCFLDRVLVTMLCEEQITEEECDGLQHGSDEK